MVGWELASGAADLQAASKAKAMKLNLGSVLTKLQPIHMCHTNLLHTTVLNILHVTNLLSKTSPICLSKQVLGMGKL